MDRDTMEFFQTLFGSLKREMHQEFEHVQQQFEDVKARLDRMEARSKAAEWTERRDSGAGS